jgi:hypothetical protein
VSRFVAYIEFRFDADDLIAGGKRLRELSEAADTVGFSMERARVEDSPPEEEDASGWTSYGPTTTS